MSTSDRQTVIYYSTIHALELIYFDSTTNEMMKKQKNYQLSAIALTNPANIFDIRLLVSYVMRKPVFAT